MLLEMKATAFKTIENMFIENLFIHICFTNGLNKKWKSADGDFN